MEVCTGSNTGPSQRPVVHLRRCHAAWENAKVSSPKIPMTCVLPVPWLSVSISPWCQETEGRVGVLQDEQGERVVLGHATPGRRSLLCAPHRADAHVSAGIFLDILFLIAWALGLFILKVLVTAKAAANKGGHQQHSANGEHRAPDCSVCVRMVPFFSCSDLSFGR